MRKIVIAATLLLFAGCGSSDEAEVSVSENESPELNVRTLVTVDSIGVELGDSNYVFGSIEAVSHTTEGNILILDRPACSVIEYTPHGEFVRRMGRKGAGPGEFLNPLAMTRLGDGRVAVLDINLGGFFTFLPDGSFEGLAHELTGEPVLWLTESIGNTYIGTMNSWELVNDEFVVTAVVARFSLDSTEPLNVYWEDSFPWDFQDITPLIKGTYFAQTWASDRNGNVFVAPRSPEEYRIQGYDFNGEPTVTIQLDLEQVAKSELEIEEEAYFWNRRAESMGANGPFTYQPYENRWMIHSMALDGENRLWVRRGTEEVPSFDVFDLQGNYLFFAEMPEINGSRGLFWEIKFDEYGILAYSLDPEEGYQKVYILELEE